MTQAPRPIPDSIALEWNEGTRIVLSMEDAAAVVAASAEIGNRDARQDCRIFGEFVAAMTIYVDGPVDEHRAEAEG